MNNNLIKITALEDAMSVLNEINKTKKLSPDSLIRAELIVNRFKNDFGEEINIDATGQFWFIN